MLDNVVSENEEMRVAIAEKLILSIGFLRIDFGCV